MDGLPDKFKIFRHFLRQLRAFFCEHYLHRKSDELQRRLQKELLSLADMDRNLNSAPGDMLLDLSPLHHLSLKSAKIGALKNREETKYLNSVQVARVMTLNKLKTGLPNVFRELMGF